jgi:hypothetical protein
VLIVADDMGYAHIGIHGSKDIPTPNIDALAKLESASPMRMSPVRLQSDARRIDDRALPTAVRT